MVSSRLLLALVAIQLACAGNPTGIAPSDQEIQLPGNGWQDVTVIPIASSLGNIISPATDGTLTKDSSAVMKDMQIMGKDPKGSAAYKKAKQDMKQKSLDMMNDFTKELGLGSIPSGAIEKSEVTVSIPGSKPITQTWENFNGKSSSKKKQISRIGGGGFVLPTERNVGALHEEDGGADAYEYRDTNNAGANAAGKQVMQHHPRWEEIADSHIATKPNSYMLSSTTRVPTRESVLSSTEVFMLAVVVLALAGLGIRYLKGDGERTVSRHLFFAKTAEKAETKVLYSKVIPVPDEGYQTIDDETHPI